MSDPPTDPLRTRTVVGVMTGTSIDGLDAAVVEITGSGLEMTAKFVRGQSWNLDDLREPLRRFADQEPTSAGEIARIEREFGVFTASCIAELTSEPPDLIAVHGQTVFHEPPVSWQMIDAAPIAHRLRAPVVFDMRSADLAAGGQGAPITPLADWVLFRSADESRVVVNLGGFCNLTNLPACGTPSDVDGCDVCACNQVLDEAARLGLDRLYDEGGEAASAGKTHVLALAELCGVLENQREAGRSLGTGDEEKAWAGKWAGVLSGNDLCRTACEGVAASIAAAVSGAERVLLAGGGVQNRFLVERLRELATVQCDLTDQHGVPSAYREAVAMAVLGALVQDRVCITLEQVTGRANDVMVGGMWVLP